MYSGNFRLVIFFFCWMCTGVASACTILTEKEQAIPK